MWLDSINNIELKNSERAKERSALDGLLFKQQRGTFGAASRKRFSRVANRARFGHPGDEM